MRSLLFILLLLSLHSAMAAERLLQVIPVEHRDAVELLSAIRPHLNEGDSASVLNQRLLIRSDLETLAAIQELVKALDQPQGQLIISVRQTPQLAGGGEVIRRYTTGSDRELNQRLRTEPGRWVAIAQGEEVPVPTAGGGGEGEGKASDGRGGQGIAYKPTASGFEVRAKLLGDGRVQIEARPFIQRPHPEGGGRIETHESSTRISGPLGEWLELGGPFSAGADRARDTGRYHSTELQSRKGYRTLIRVERID